MCDLRCADLIAMESRVKLLDLMNLVFCIRTCIFETMFDDSSLCKVGAAGNQEGSQARGPAAGTRTQEKPTQEEVKLCLKFPSAVQQLKC